jgi:hypothetical protein
MYAPLSCTRDFCGLAPFPSTSALACEIFRLAENLISDLLRDADSGVADRKISGVASDKEAVSKLEGDREGLYFPGRSGPRKR